MNVRYVVLAALLPLGFTAAPSVLAAPATTTAAPAKLCYLFNPRLYDQQWQVTCEEDKAAATPAQPAKRCYLFNPPSIDRQWTVPCEGTVAALPPEPVKRCYLFNPPTIDRQWTVPCEVRTETAAVARGGSQ